jgi:hypothetical protein
MSRLAQIKIFDLVFDAVLPRTTIRIIDFGSLDIKGGPQLLLEPFNFEYISVDLDVRA